MNLEITPEPSAEERAAIVAALELLLARASGAGAWGEAGIREAVEESEGESG